MNNQHERNLEVIKVKNANGLEDIKSKKAIKITEIETTQKYLG